MALAAFQYEGDGSNTTFNIPFEYIDRTHILVFVAGGPYADFVFLDDQRVDLAVPPALGVVVEIRRDTPSSTKMVEYIDGSTITADNLNRSGDQQFFLVQEALDAVEGALRPAADGTYSAGLKRISNVAAPTGSADAATKGYVDTAVVNQSGTVTAAEAARDASVIARTASEAARDKAEKWAEEAEDVVVSTVLDGGETINKYSAKHHAQKAANSAASVDIPVAAPDLDVDKPLLGDALGGYKLAAFRLTANSGTIGPADFGGVAFGDIPRGLFVNTSQAGIYDTDLGAWKWAFNDAGELITGTVPVAKVPGLAAGKLNAASIDTKTDAGAISLTTRATNLITTQASALTLANGEAGVPQHKTIVMKTHGGDGTVTPATAVGFSWIAFFAVGQAATLFWNGEAWYLESVRNAAVG